MSRNTDLSSRNVLRRKPFSHLASCVSGPLSFFNPTSAQIHSSSLAFPYASASESDDHGATAKPRKSQLAFSWSSRNNRKGRHALAISPSLDASSTPTPPAAGTFGEIRKGLWRMVAEYPYWDVSWLVAVVFTIGSVVWCINGFFSWLPLVRPSTMFSTESAYGAGITAFIGATIFEIGSVLLMIEAVNENRSDCFGWAVEEKFAGSKEDREKGTSPMIHPAACLHHHANRRNFVGKGAATPTSSSLSGSSADSSSSDMMAKEKSREEEVIEEKRREWRWWPSWKELHTHYLREIGFLACSAQMFGATVFWISGFTALPGILNVLSPRLLIGIYWVPQIIGGSGFIVSGILFMLETQKKWYRPALDTLGWHIGFHNFLGGLGFTLCPCFGIDTASWAQYEAALTTFWASWFFLIGSVIQWYESQSKNPVSVEEIEAPSSAQAPAAGRDQ